jgi:hypothetical protein
VLRRRAAYMLETDCMFFVHSVFVMSWNILKRFVMSSVIHKLWSLFEKVFNSFFTRDYLK